MPDALPPDYISPEEIEERRRRGEAERRTQRQVLLLFALSAAVLVLSELFLW